jgi:hypothetical protein
MPTARLHLPRLRQQLLSASSYLCLALFLTDAAPVNAADQLTVKPAFDGKATFADRAFFSVEGGYWFNRSAKNLGFDPTDDNLGGLAPLRPGRNGGTFGFGFGYSIDPVWDWRFAYRVNSFAKANATDPDPSATASNKLWFQYFDLEFGYRPRSIAGADVRIFAGPRLLNAHNHMSYGFIDGSKLGNFDHDVELWGVGPRAGIQASFPLGQSPASLKVAAAGSVIFSHVDHRSIFASRTDVGNFSGNSNTGSSPTVYNVEGSVGVGFRIHPKATVEIGYQAQQWWNLTNRVRDADKFGNFTSGRNDVLVHGPVAKITVALP